MESVRKKHIDSVKWILITLILLLYPLTHISDGIDLWDGGYNYANFKFSGLAHMDSMWYFATWLANQVGSFFTALPYGSTCIGMNVYTGLVISAMSLTAFFFCVRKLHMPSILVLTGQLIAISLCWAPSGMLYSYLTYAFILVATIFLYLGLIEDKNSYLVIAGVVLGWNVAVRFSNLVQMGLILAVWGYGVIDRKKLRRVLQQTGFCIAGYAGALGTFLGIMAWKYGLGNYIEGILRLFQMTEQADDYSPGWMLLGMVWAYYDCLYFLKRFALALIIGILFCVLLPASWKKTKKGITIAIMAILSIWLIGNRFCSGDYASYTSIYYPCVTVLTLTLCLSFYQLIDRKASGENKLLGILLMLTILITSLGGNNAIYSSMNNLFLVLPGFLWLVWGLCKENKCIRVFPVQCLLLVAIGFLLVQSVRFDRKFVYEEAAGEWDLTYRVEKIPVLKGMKTNPQKAEALESLYQYITDNGLQDKKCILYGEIPGVAYYMDLEPAMNIWSDLRSYHYKIMERDLKAVSQRPVIIMTTECSQYVSGEAEEDLFWDKSMEDKMNLLCSYIEDNQFVLTFQNDKFAIYE